MHENGELTYPNPWLAGQTGHEGAKRGKMRSFAATGTSSALEGLARTTFVQGKGSRSRRHSLDSAKVHENTVAHVVDGTAFRHQLGLIVGIEKLSGARQGAEGGVTKPFSPSIIHVLKSLTDANAVLRSNRDLINDLLVGSGPASPVTWRRIAERCSFEGLAKAILSIDFDFETWLPVRQPVQGPLANYVTSHPGIAVDRDEPTWCVDVSRSLLEEDHLEGAAAEAKARDALADAGALARREGMRRPTSTNVSEDGVVSLKWGSGRNGLLVVLSGGGEASFSVKADAEFFDRIHDFAIEGGLPHAAKVALEALPSL